MRVRIRDRRRDSGRRIPAVHETALFHGAQILLAQKDAEIARLRALLAAHGIEDPEGGR